MVQLPDSWEDWLQELRWWLWSTLQDVSKYCLFAASDLLIVKGVLCACVCLFVLEWFRQGSWLNPVCPFAYWWPQADRRGSNSPADVSALVHLKLMGSGLQWCLINNTQNLDLQGGAKSVIASHLQRPQIISYKQSDKLRDTCACYSKQNIDGNKEAIGSNKEYMIVFWNSHLDRMSIAFKWRSRVV